MKILNVSVDGKLTNWFSVLIGLRKAACCHQLLSTYFWNSSSTKSDAFPNASPWTIMNSLLLNMPMIQKLQELTSQLQDACTEWGMKINNGEWKVLTSSQQHITIEGNDIENVNGFVFLGSSVPDVKVDIDWRIALAFTAFGRLCKSIWSKQNINMELKMRLFRAFIIPIAIYGAETWVLITKE